MRYLIVGELVRNIKFLGVDRKNRNKTLHCETNTYIPHFAHNLIRVPTSYIITKYDI